MMRLKFIILVLGAFLNAQQINIENFQSDLYSKNSTNFKKIVLDMQLTSTQNADEAQLKDALNVIIGSFYAEDLMTSKGKEALKGALIQYSKQKYNIKIERIYILALKFAPDIDINAFKTLIEQKCQTSLNETNSKQNAQKSAQKLIQEQMKNNAKIIDGIKDFGDIDFYQ